MIRVFRLLVCCGGGKGRCFVFINDSSDKSPLPRNASSWATPVERMDVGDLPEEAINLNVAGRRPTSPLQGFGQLWQKTYRIQFDEVVPPQKVIEEWKEHFPEFWPQGNRFSCRVRP